MRIFKTTYNDRLGKKRTSSKWYVEFRDHLERVRRLPLFTDESASKEAGRRIEKLVATKLAGSEPDADLTRWLAGMDSGLRQRLANVGVVDASRVEASRPLIDHIEDFRLALLGKGTSNEQAGQASRRTRYTLVDGCKFKHYSSIGPGAVRDFLTVRRQPKFVVVDGKRIEKPGISAQTSNHILVSCKSFCAWMVREGRAIANPLACLAPLSEKTVKQDLRHPRRIEPPTTVARLIAITATQPDREGMKGVHRALMYRVAVETGLRAGELASLTRSSLRLDAATPHVAIHDGNTKNGRDADVPLLPTTKQILAEHVKDMHSNALVFAMPPKERLSKVFYADLEAADIQHCDDQGYYFDFHSLRHCTATYLVDRGVDAKVVQDIMRHRDLRTTMRYVKATVVAKRAEALASMPDLSTPVVKEATNNASVSADAKQDAKTNYANSVSVRKSSSLRKNPSEIAKPLYAGSTPAGAFFNPSLDSA